MNAAEYLVAALDKADQVAKDSGDYIPGEAPDDLFRVHDDDFRYPVHADSAAILRLTAAQRKIADLHGGTHECPSEESSCGWVEAPATCETIRLLAQGWGWEEDR